MGLRQLINPEGIFLCQCRHFILWPIWFLKLAIEERNSRLSPTRPKNAQISFADVSVGLCSLTRTFLELVARLVAETMWPRNGMDDCTKVWFPAFTVKFASWYFCKSIPPRRANAMTSSRYTDSVVPKNILRHVAWLFRRLRLYSPDQPVRTDVCRLISVGLGVFFDLTVAAW